MDEPTASLTEREMERLFAVIARLREQGVGIIYISHRLDEVFAIADRVTVLRDGDSRGHATTRPTLDRDGSIRLMVGRELSRIFPKRPVPLGDIVFEVTQSDRARGRHSRRLACGARRRDSRPGRAGRIGAHRTRRDDFRPDAGGRRARSGCADPRSRSRSPRDAIAAGIAYVPRIGVATASSSRCRSPPTPHSRASRRFRDAGCSTGAPSGRRRRTSSTACDIRASSILAEAGSLSGGNQQKVALARWLATDPRVLILDEPTQGVDVGAKAEIHALMQDLAEQGLAVVMISSELPEILGMSDRIAVMRDGTIAGVLSREEATQQAVLALALGDAA